MTSSTPSSAQMRRNDMDTATTKEARPRYQRKARHTTKRGGISLTPAAKDGIFAITMLVLCLCLVWGVSAMYQRGYVDGYEDAKAAYHG
ncbi:MAG: hypothetical protein IJ111_05915 [Eggerthellaceae bacterium]|nr:hypothetical protein [Eggerthellaceae bacterium]